MKKLFLLVLAAIVSPIGAVEFTTLQSKSPIVDVKIMVGAGSAQDPAGLEGLASMTGKLLIEGSFGEPTSATTKDVLAEITRPWGSGAYPRVTVSKESTVFHFSVPREHVSRYIDLIIKPMFQNPIADARELDRLRGEAHQELRSGLRLERIEDLGLYTLDNWIHDKTTYAHPAMGTENGLANIDRFAILKFYRTYYLPEKITVAISSDESNTSGKLKKVLTELGNVKGGGFGVLALGAPKAISGRSVLIVTLPNAIATGIHAGFPISVNRSHPDYWPLYVANVWFGTHRDGFSHLYEVIREQRGYNYGAYSYIEHFEGRPYRLFAPLNYPRHQQYFSMWVRPVASAWAAHLVRGITWELDKFIREGLTEEQCRLSKNKARVLYLSLAETGERILASRLDDSFYGVSGGYLTNYLKNIDSVNCVQVNAAIKNHLQSRDVKYVVVTNAQEAQKIAAALLSEQPQWGKTAVDYLIDVKEEPSGKVFNVPQAKLEILQRDSNWAYTRLDLKPSDIRIVEAAKMFESAAIP